MLFGKDSRMLLPTNGIDRAVRSLKGRTGAFEHLESSSNKPGIVINSDLLFDPVHVLHFAERD